MRSEKQQYQGTNTNTKNIKGTVNSRFLGNIFYEKKEYRIDICY